MKNHSLKFWNSRYQTEPLNSLSPIKFIMNITSLSRWINLLLNAISVFNTLERISQLSYLGTQTKPTHCIEYLESWKQLVFLCESKKFGILPVLTSSSLILTQLLITTRLFIMGDSFNIFTPNMGVLKKFIN